MAVSAKKRESSTVPVPFFFPGVMLCTPFKLEYYNTILKGFGDLELLHAGPTKEIRYFNVNMKSQVESTQLWLFRTITKLYLTK
jgi:hypothetical protein